MYQMLFETKRKLLTNVIKSILGDSKFLTQQLHVLLAGSEEGNALEMLHGLAATCVQSFK